jgi:hypothetical protein
MFGDLESFSCRVAAPRSMKKGVAQTAAFGGLRLFVLNPELPRTNQKNGWSALHSLFVCFQESSKGGKIEKLQMKASQAFLLSCAGERGPELTLGSAVSQTGRHLILRSSVDHETRRILTRSLK